MSIVLRKRYTKYDLKRTQDKRVIYITLWLLRYVTDAYCPKEAPCQVTIATKYVANVYCPKEALYQMWTQ